jgi:subtilisin family serine protease
VFVLLVAGGASAAFAQVAPQDSGKMSWDFFLVVQAGQRTKAVGGQAEVATALLTTTEEATASDLEALTALGYTVLGSFGRYVLVEASADHYTDPEQGVEGISFVTNVMLPPATITNDDVPITSGTEAISAPEAWSLGYRGQGKKIAIIDEGFDTGNPILATRGAKAYLIKPAGTGPRAYVALEGQVAVRSDHGTSCAIIAGDVAPDAELFLLSYPGNAGPIGFLCALAYAVEKLKVDVVSCSTEFNRPSCHADGTGIVNEEVTKILAASTTTLVMASGNWARGAGGDRWIYNGDFSDADGDFAHDFTTGAEERWNRNTLAFTAQRGNRIQIVLEWDDWATDSKTTDLNLFLYDFEYHMILSSSTSRQFGRANDPVEVVSGELPYSGEYHIMIENAGARWYGGTTQTASFQLYVFCKGGGFEDVEHHSACGTVREVASNPHVIAVGAVAPGSGEVREYSSRGPTAGGRAKPELCAPDGVTGTVYESFAGTSASAPYVAGAIALLRDVRPDLTSADALAVLQETAVRSVDSCRNAVLAIDIAKAIARLKST